MYQHHLSVDHLCFICCVVHSAEDVNSIYKESNSIKKLRHKNIVEQEIKLKDGDPSVAVTRPCRFMIEVPETLFETVKIEPGDTILKLPNAI